MSHSAGHISGIGAEYYPILVIRASSSCKRRTESRLGENFELNAKNDFLVFNDGLEQAIKTWLWATKTHL